MKGVGWQKLHHPDHIERVLDGMRRGFASAAPWEDTFPLRGRDGNYRWFLTRVMPIRDDAGEVVRWFGTNTDVTEQIEAESALREINATLEERVAAETQERLRIWNVSQDLLMVANEEGRYLSVNPMASTLGWSGGGTARQKFPVAAPSRRSETRAEIARRCR
jgi:PAS domain-containing protein